MAHLCRGRPFTISLPNVSSDIFSKIVLKIIFMKS
jgi:hypothetical protein